MVKVRYRKGYIGGIVTIVLCVLLFGFMLAYSILAEVQFSELIENMDTTYATVTDIRTNIHRRGHTQEMQISYTVDGKTYNRELGTDTFFSYEAGHNTSYKTGDKVKIYYDPENPMRIATKLSLNTGRYYTIIAGVGFAIVLFALACAIAARKRNIITEEEYQKEKSEKKEQKAAYKNWAAI